MAPLSEPASHRKSRRRHWFSWRRFRRKLSLDQRNVAIQIILGVACAFLFFRVLLFFIERLS